MRCLLIMFGFILSVAGICSAGYVDEVLVDNPFAYYRFEESVGATNITDSSGNGHDSLEISNVVFGAAGAIGSGGTFSNAWARLDLQRSVDAGDFSIEALVRFDSTGGNRNFVSQQNGSGTGRSLLYRAGDGYVETYLGGSVNATDESISEGTWHHIVMTVQDAGTSNIIRFYVDGQPDGTGSETAEFANGDWVLGAAKYYASPLIGALDEIAIYTNLLSAGQVSAHFSALVYSDPDTVSTGSAGNDASHNNMQPWLGITHLIALEGDYPSPGGGNSGNTMLGEVTMFAGNFAPSGWAKADGQLLSAGANTLLYSVLGVTYGGDGRTTFSLPDLRGRTAIHQGNGPGLSPHLLGHRFGNENVTLTQQQMPSHSHSMAPYGNTYATGGGQPFSTLQPSLALTYTIAVDDARFDDPNTITSNGPTFLGEIQCFAGNFAFDGTSKLDGQLLNLSGNTNLFSLLGTAYGGDGTTTFGLPELRGRTPVGAGQGSGLSNVTLGSRFGVENITLAESQLLSHTHEWTSISGTENTQPSGSSNVHENRQPSLGINYIIAVEGNVPSQNGGLQEHFMGEIIPFAGDFAPQGWAFADGQLLPINQNHSLFNLLGTTFGGDGRTTFALPDLRSRTPIHTGQGTGLSNRMWGQRAGAEEKTAGLPAHTHQHLNPFSPTHYVSKEGAAIPPYTTWFSAASNITDVMNSAFGDDTIFVNDGIYTPGSEIIITTDMTLNSINGPDVTIIDGQNTHRCLNLGSSDCTISGFTIRNGYVNNANGGGILCSSTNPVITNCTLTGNSVTSWGDGGGIYLGTLSHCIISNNSAGDRGYGGGIHSAILTHCTISSNSAGVGGGSRSGNLTHCLLKDNIAQVAGGSSDGTLTHCTLAGNEAAVLSGYYAASGKAGGYSSSSLKNCIVWSNTAEVSDNNWQYGSISYSCTTPDPGGTGNTTNNPQFISASDFRLQAGSPCIDKGINLTGFVTDLDGNPRPLDGNADGTATADMGAYEYFNATADSDGDSITDGDEQIADTDMTNSNEWFHISGFDGSELTFDSSAARQYTLQYSLNLTNGLWFDVFSQTDIMGSGGSDTLTAPVPTNDACFYRIKVEIP